MELKEHATTPTLAQKLGDTAHVSGLAIRLERVSGAGGRLPEWLLKVAVARGAKHYQRDFDAGLPPDNPSITDEEIGVALCLGQNPYSLDALRVAAQLLSSPRTDAVQPVSPWHSGKMRTSAVAHCGDRQEARTRSTPVAICARAPSSSPRTRTEALPHWTRVVSYCGLTRDGSSRIDWLCRHE